MSRGPVYANQQLRLVALETFFAGKLSMLSDFGRVQDELIEAFPHLFVPNDGTDAPALRPYQLRSADQVTTLALALNQATYASQLYPGAEEFVPSALATLDKVHRHARVSTLTRVRYRYENEISVGVQDVRAALAAILNARWLERLCPTEVEGLHIDVTERAGDSDKLGMLLLPEVRPGRVVVVLNLIGSVGKSLPVADLPSSVDRIRKLARARFEDMISDQFRATLKGSS